MRVSGFSLLLAAVCALVALASIAVPAGAEQPPGDMRRIEVPTGELSPTLRPAEAPPPDFTASQYIDSAGCVFIRAEGGWRGRTDRGGTAVCGYPPTLSARRIGPDSTPALFPEPELPRAARIERDLTEAIIPNLQAAELARGGAPGAAAALPPVSPAGGQGPQAETPPDPLKIGAVVAKAPALSRQMAGPGRTDRLCALIGGSPANGAGLGLCGDAPPLASLSQALPGAKDGRVTGQSVAARADSATTAASKADARRQKARITAKEAPRASRAGAPARTSRPDDMRMIPPGARFVQAGSFRDAGQAQAAAGRLARTGVPVVRAKEAGAELILVGPLDRRESIVRMIERLRRTGYRDLRARR